MVRRVCAQTFGHAAHHAIADRVLRGARGVLKSEARVQDLMRVAAAGGVTAPGDVVRMRDGASGSDANAYAYGVVVRTADDMCTIAPAARRHSAGDSIDDAVGVDVVDA